MAKHKYRYRVRCAGCSAFKDESLMKIYDVTTDKYFCKQGCKDNHDGIKRNKAGIITKQQF